MRKKPMINSSRMFQLAIIEAGYKEIITTHTNLECLVFPDENDTEVLYALNDKLDKILDLKKGEAMYFRPIRDNKKSKGIIMRIE